MKNTISGALALFTTAAIAQLDRAGNVIEDGGSSGSGANGAVFLFIGAGLGLVVTMFQPNLSTKFCVIAGAVLGLLGGMLLHSLR